MPDMRAVWHFRAVICDGDGSVPISNAARAISVTMLKSVGGGQCRCVKVCYDFHMMYLSVPCSFLCMFFCCPLQGCLNVVFKAKLFKQLACGIIGHFFLAVVDGRRLQNDGKISARHHGDHCGRHRHAEDIDRLRFKACAVIAFLFIPRLQLYPQAA